jgi:hypothetical protein
VSWEEDLAFTLKTFFMPRSWQANRQLPDVYIGSGANRDGARFSAPGQGIEWNMFSTLMK